MTHPALTSDSVVVVTGGASGIGRASSVRLAQAGAAVMVADLDADGAKVTAEMVNGEGGRAASLQLDVTDETAVEKSLQQTDAIQREDMELCANVQRGLRSSSYQVGVYATSEVSMLQFHQLLSADLTPLAAAR